MGHGGETERAETYRGTTVKVALQEKVRLEIGVSEPFVAPTVKAILAAARTGEVGDGKVFVLDLAQVHRIRTGERDQAAVTPAAKVGRLAGPASCLPPGVNPSGGRARCCRSMAWKIVEFAGVHGRRRGGRGARRLFLATRPGTPPGSTSATYDRVALVTFSADQSKNGLGQLATQRFAEEVLASQTGFELLELGPADSAVARLLAEGDAPAAAQELGRDRHIPGGVLRPARRDQREAARQPQWRR